MELPQQGNTEQGKLKKLTKTDFGAPLGHVRELSANPPTTSGPEGHSNSGFHSQAHPKANQTNKPRQNTLSPPPDVRGKRNIVTPQGRDVSMNVEHERSKHETQEMEYEAALDHNIRRAEMEAERQTSATKMERAGKHMMRLHTPPTPSRRRQMEPRLGRCVDRPIG
jgi:hypothetical protein